MSEGVGVQVRTDTTETGGMRFTVTYGPTLASVIFDPNDAELVLDCLRTGFAEAKAARDNHVLTG
jgi:hypothetical protein